MLKILHAFILLSLILSSKMNFAAPDNVQISVWANEAIVATYSFDAAHFMEAQKKIAQYFTTEAWIEYSKALQASKLPETIKANNFTLSSVATLPPVITALDDSHWKAVMPLLVFYKGPALQQKQELMVTLTIVKAPGNQGVRGFAIASFQTKESKPPCSCEKPSA